MTTKRAVNEGESGERGESAAENKADAVDTHVKGSPIDPDHAAGYPTKASTHLNEEGKPVWGLPVGPEFDDSFPTYHFDEVVLD